MFNRRLVFALPVAAVIVATGCRLGDRAFPPVGAITTIKIVGRDSRELAPPISEQQSISKIVAFVDGERDGWNVPTGGIPVPKVVAEFYDGDTFKGHFGVGERFFESQRAGGFFSKKASPSNVEEFLKLLGVPKEELKR